MQNGGAAMASEMDRNVENTSGRHTQKEGTAPKFTGSGCTVLMTVSLGLVCLLLLSTIVLQHFMIQAERDVIKNYESKEYHRFCSTGQYSQPKKGDQCLLDGFIVSLEKKNWFDSREFCRNHGADLLIIKSKEKQMRLFSLVKRIDLMVWIGLSDTENEGHMTWVDNSTLNQGFWRQGEPSDRRGNENCVVINPEPDLKNWNDITCSHVTHFFVNNMV